MADTHESILAAAAERAREKNEPVAGLLTPAEAWALREAGEIQIVDTRTHAERDLVGYVPGTIHIEWYDYPAKVRNDHFLDDLRGKVDPGRPVAFWRSATKREGTGLGLSYVRAAATAHNGSVTVGRSSVDGAFVGCTLPRGVSPAPALPSAAARADEPAFR